MVPNEMLVKLTTRLVKRGILYIPKDAAEHFPKGSKPFKIKALFGDDTQEFELRYDPKRIHIYGLTRLYRKHKARLSDAVAIRVN